jgi:hypothetical protein
MSTQSGTAGKSKKYNIFQILLVEWFMYFVILVLLDGDTNSMEECAGGAFMLLALIRGFLFIKKQKS